MKIRCCLSWYLITTDKFKLYFQMQSPGVSEGQHGEVTTSLANARRALEELRLDEAETLFLQTWDLAQEKCADVTVNVHIYTGW